MKNSLLVLIFAFLAGGLWSADSSASTKKALLDEVTAKWTTSATVEAAPKLRPSPTADFVLEDIAMARAPLTQVMEEIVSQVKALGGPVYSYMVMGSSDPEVTLSLKKALFSDVLDLICESTGMTCERRGGLILFRPAGAVGVLKTQSYPVSASLLTRLLGSEAVKSGNRNDPNLPSAALYDRALAEASLRAFFERLGVQWSEGSGMVLADGELMVTHNSASLQKIESVLSRLSRHRQVEIEARFMEVEEGVLNELGVQWNLANPGGTKTIGTSGVTTGSNTLRTLADTFASAATTAGATAPDVPGSVNVARSTSATADITGVIDSWNLQGVLRALSQENGTELLSAPRLTVLSGSTANITVAQELRYPQSYDRVNTDVGSGTTSGSIITAPTPLDFTTRNVGVQMRVTPYVEEDGSITLILEPEVTKFERFIDYGGQSVVVNGNVTETLPSGFFQPVFSVRKLTTEVNLASGSTVLMGGLTREESVKTKDKVPLLGDIPLLGKAFRSEGQSTQKRNLVVFVTAKVVE